MRARASISLHRRDFVMKISIGAIGTGFAPPSVEAEEQARLLRLLRCDELAGWLSSKVVPASEFEARLLAPGMQEPH